MFRSPPVPQSVLDEPEKLARYRVLYLADIPQLTPRRRENLERFVENGGGLLACYGTSLYGAAGERLERFELESLLRVRPAHPQGELAETLKSYRCMTGGPNDLYLTPHAATDGPLVPLGYFEPVEVLDGGSTMMDIVTGDGRRPILPGVVTSTHGKGRVVYLASSLESLYSSTKESVLGSCLRSLVEYAAATPPPYQVTAPSFADCQLDPEWKPPRAPLVELDHGAGQRERILASHRECLRAFEDTRGQAGAPARGLPRNVLPTQAVRAGTGIALPSHQCLRGGQL